MPESLELIYRVRGGDTPEGIAEEFGVSVSSLLRLNRTDKIYPGMRLLIPLPPKAVYRVRPTDTAESIAAQFGMTAEELLKLNHVSRIYTGLDLTVSR